MILRNFITQDGSHYMIYTPSDPLLFVATKVNYTTSLATQMYSSIYSIINSDFYAYELTVISEVVLVWMNCFISYVAWILSKSTYILSLNLALLFIGMQDHDGRLQIADDVRNPIPFLVIYYLVHWLRLVPLFCYKMICHALACIWFLSFLLIIKKKLRVHFFSRVLLGLVTHR